MSFGALSSAAVTALSEGAAAGGFALNTGEGGVSPYHLAGGADLIWQIGTGYFGCRTKSGSFDASRFADQASHPNIKAIEITLPPGTIFFKPFNQELGKLLDEFFLCEPKSLETCFTIQIQVRVRFCFSEVFITVCIPSQDIISVLLLC